MLILTHPLPKKTTLFTHTHMVLAPSRFLVFNITGQKICFHTEQFPNTSNFAVLFFFILYPGVGGVGGGEGGGALSHVFNVFGNFVTPSAALRHIIIYRLTCKRRQLDASHNRHLHCKTHSHPSAESRSQRQFCQNIRDRVSS